MSGVGGESRAVGALSVGQSTRQREVLLLLALVSPGQGLLSSHQIGDASPDQRGKVEQVHRRDSAVTAAALSNS